MAPLGDLRMENTAKAANAVLQQVLRLKPATELSVLSFAS